MRVARASTRHRSAVTLTSVTLSNASFVGGSSGGTTVGTITVGATGGAFTGSLSLTGASAAAFQLSGNTLQTSGVQTAGLFRALNIVATQTGAPGSPFTQAVNIQGTMPVPAGYTGTKSFQDAFTGVLDTSKWTAQMGASGSWWLGSGSYAVSLPRTTEGSSGGFHEEYFDPGQVSMLSPGLRITAIRDTTSYPGIYSWKSGVACTMGKFAMGSTTNYFQCCAKLPDCNYGMWPAIWHMEGTGGTGEVDTLDGGFAHSGTNPDGSAAGSPDSNHMILAKDFAGASPELYYNTGSVDLSQGFHTYGLEFKPGVSLKWYFDGALIFTDATGSMSGSLEIILMLQVASSATSGWHSYDTGLSVSPSLLDISEVQVYTA